MKKIALLFAAVMVMGTASAQVVVGLQGGYFQNSVSNNLDVDAVKNTNWLGGAQVGYMITPKLYVGVSGAYNSFCDDTMQTHNLVVYGDVATPRTVDNYHTVVTYSGWEVAPQVRYEFLSYGNMHFHLLLQGSVAQRGYSTTVVSYNTPALNNGEYHEEDPLADSIKTFTWGVSLRPTLTYEFSRHLSAELSLDFLSIGYAKQTVTHEAASALALDADGNEVAPQQTQSTLYAGLNTLKQTLRWESPMLRLGFNWTF